MGYQILAYALEAIAQKKFGTMLQQNVIDKLGLNRTFYQKPADDSIGIIPQGNEAGWSWSIGEGSP